MVSTAEFVAQDAPPGELVLRICGTSRDGQVIRVRSPKCTVGSGPRSTLRLHANGVRPVHCLIVRGRRALVVRRWSPDTRLNGRTFGDAELAAGDRLSIGPIEFEVLDAGLPDERQFAPPEGTDSPSSGPDKAAEALDRRGSQPFDERRRQARHNGRRRLRRLVRELRSARQKLAEIEARREEATHEHIRQLSELREDLARSQAAHDDERRRWEAQRLELDARSISAGRQWEAERTEAEARLTAHRNELDARAEQIGARDRETRRRAEQLEAKSAQLETRAAELEAQAGQLQTGEKELQAQAERLETREQELGSRFEQLDQQGRELQARSEQLQTREQEIQSQAEELNELAARLETKAEELAAEQAELEARLAEAEAERQDRHAEADSGGLRSGPSEEIRFEAVSRDAPQSTTEVFQRLGAMPLLPEDDGQEDVAAQRQSPASGAPLTAKPNPLGFAAIGRDESPVNAAGGEEDDSIDEYMARLLERVRGGGSSPQSPAGAATVPFSFRQATPPERVTEPEDAAEESPPPQAEGMEQVAKPAPVELAPRAAAPERHVDLSAMRELANFSARQAIDRYSRRMLSRSLLGKLSISAVSLLTGVVLAWFWWVDRSNAVAFYAAATSFVVSAFWAVQHFVDSKRVLGRSGGRGGKDRKPAATSDEGP